MRDVLSDLDRWQDAGEDIALATLVGTRGASPRAAGARLCCTRTGRMTGSVSGGCVEGDVFARAMGFETADRARIHTPIGLDIGARTPEEVALAIPAEIVAVRRGRAGGTLRDRPGPVHAADGRDG